MVTKCGLRSRISMNVARGVFFESNLDMGVSAAQSFEKLMYVQQLWKHELCQKFRNLYVYVLLLIPIYDTNDTLGKW